MEGIELVGGHIINVGRCPQCGVSNPLLTPVNNPSLHHRDTDGDGWFYVAVQCSKCLRQTLFYGYAARRFIDASGVAKRLIIIESFPSIKRASEDVPERARSFLQQALESVHAPDGAIMLAASSIYAMLKEKGYKDGSLYHRINLAQENGLFTKEMTSWAHEVRLNANEPRHADEKFVGATEKDARHTIEFAEALGEYLFVLPARVKKGKIEASGTIAAQ